MNIKQLIKEVERLNNRLIYCRDEIEYLKIKSNISYVMQKDMITSLELEIRDIKNKLQGIKQTVEAVDKYVIAGCVISEFENDIDNTREWQTLKKLLGIK